MGSCLNIRQIGYNWPAFARQAFKVQVDVDPAEFAKPMVKPDLAMEADLNDFLQALDARLSAERWQAQAHHQPWLGWCKAYLARCPNAPPHQCHPAGERINPYHFSEALFAQLGGNDIVACGNATATIVPFQAGRIIGGSPRCPSRYSCLTTTAISRSTPRRATSSVGWQVPDRTTA